MDGRKERIKFLLTKYRDIIEEFFLRNYVGDKYLSEFTGDLFTYLSSNSEHDIGEDVSRQELYVILIDFFIFRMKRLSREICENNEHAWSLFKHMFEPMFHRIISDMGIKDEETHREILQEFYLFLIKKCRENRFNYRGRALLSSYLHRTFRNFLINKLEREGGRASLKSLDELYEMGRDMGQKDRRSPCDVIKTRMQSLNFPQEDILLVMLMCDGYNQKEIAKILGRSTSFVSKRKERIFEILRRNLSPEDLLS